MEQLLTIKEVAEMLQLAELTVHRLKQNGKLPYVRIGHAVRYRPSDVADFIDSRTTREEPEADYRYKRQVDPTEAA